MEARAKQLASFALEKLSYQATLHASEPEIYRENYMSVAQLRDDVLRDEFSADRRKKLWDKVAKKVEGNANVRPAVREGRSGDVGRVWEWTGAVGYLESATGVENRRKSGRMAIAPADDLSMVARGDSSVLKREDVKTSKWAEAKRPYF
jgi:hypothetical protein